MGCFASKLDRDLSPPDEYPYGTAAVSQQNMPAWGASAATPHYLSWPHQGGQSDADSSCSTQFSGLYDCPQSRNRPFWIPEMNHEYEAPVRGLQFQASSSQEIAYEVTARGIDQLKGVVYPDHVFDNLSHDMHILDIGAGKGKFVRDLRSLGFRNARGIDKEEKSSQVLRVDITNLDSNSYGQKLDRIFSSWSLFTYKEPMDMQEESLRKMANWLKPGGKIYLGPVDGDRIGSLIGRIPQLEKTNSGHLFSSSDQQWVELSLT